MRLGERLSELRRLLGRDVSRDVDEELEFHIAMRVAELVESGEPPARARELALQRFGDMGGPRGECVAIQGRRRKRAARSDWWQALRQDLGYAGRALRKRPGFTALAVLTLALGTGANTAVFSVVDALVMRALPYAEADRLVAVWSDRGALSRAEYVALAERVSSLEAAEAYQSGVGLTLGTDEDSPAARVEGALTTPGLFAFLGVRPVLGRGFLPEESDPGRGDVALLSHRLWRERFGGDPGVVGRTIQVDGAPRTVVGVMPESFAFPSLRDRLTRSRFATTLLLLFALLALLLGAVGIYGVVSHATARRLPEFGVRMALGARAADLVTLTLRHAAVLALAGIAVGLPAAWAATRALNALLYDTSATDPLTFTLVPLILAAVTLLAAWIPARRAGRVDPVRALDGG